MQTFKDENEMTWGVEITRPVLRVVKQEMDILLTDLFQDEMALITQLCNDPLLAGDVLWLVCREQAKNRNMDEAAFVKATDGDCFENAVKALIEAIIDFFPNARQRTVMRTALKAGEEMIPEMNSLIVEAIPKAVNAELEVIRERLRSFDGTTSSVESSESTETDTAFAS